MAMPKNRGEKEEMESRPLVSTSVRDSSLSLFRMLSILIVFVVGVVIGLASSSHIGRYFTADQFFPSRAVVSSSDTNCTIVVNNCEKEDCLSLKSFISPKNLTHGLSDEELFWRASLVPQKVEYPFDRVPKVAFMFMTRGPLPLLPLWERFFQGQDVNKYSIYVHALPGYVLNVTSSSVFYGRQIPSKNVEWGSVSLVDAEKRLLANALLDFSNERFVLLSESCIPVYNFPTVYKYLTRSVHSFVESYDDPSRYGRGRYSRRMRPDIKLGDWRKGSQWFELNRQLAAVIVADTKYYTIFKKYCRPACYPDEHYLPTFIHMFYGSMNANRTVTYVDWSVIAPHPGTFSAENVTESFLQSLRKNATACSYNLKSMTNVCYLFARKFTPNTLEPLLNLSSKVMQF
ncbi:OLC1v1038854C1 [Oldenlandia corymbosa var. corymbosa]|uniref:OLC1v1038854C1 n=1 Tax=Oldenlandia corymbosa var. corymbosa TaxID=529605 RepID=A0AAV1D3E5_OLDCO|nr:OLC1v1038854C1 [Oldenlandia corymbosa var. corymbosa]